VRVVQPNDLVSENPVSDGTMTMTWEPDATCDPVVLPFSQSWSWSTGAYEIPTIAPSGDCSLATV
jgi:hypothetical protein